MSWRWGRAGAANVADALAGPLELVPSDGTGGSVVLSGRYRGLPVEVRVSKHGKVDLRCPFELPLVMSLESEPPGGSRGTHEVTIGDPELDARLKIQADNPAGVIRLLRSPEIKAPLLALFEQHPGTRLSQAGLIVPHLQDASVAGIRAAFTAMEAAVSAVQARARMLHQAREQRIAKVRKGPRPSLKGMRFVRVTSGEDRRDEQTIRAYARRVRQSWLYVLLPSELFGLAGWAWVMGFVPKAQDRLIFLSATVGVFALIGAKLAAWRDRCPHCHARLPRDEDADFRTALHGRYESCPFCEARLLPARRADVIHGKSIAGRYQDAVRRGWTALGVGAAAAVGSFYVPGWLPVLSDRVVPWVQAGGFLALSVAMWLFSVSRRCPACGRNTAGNPGALTFKQSECAHCGAQLELSGPVP